MNYIDTHKKNILIKIKEIYESGGNIIQYLKELHNTMSNDIEDILISYDFQAGSYIQSAQKNNDYIEKYTAKITETLSQLGNINSILEVGIGEATTLANVITKFDRLPDTILGFDLSWSRIKYANAYMNSKQIPNFLLFTGDLFNAPIVDNSIDIVYTSHSIEPNGGKEKEALLELYRITKKYLVLLEPSYEFANEEGKARMLKHGYVKGLYDLAISLKMNVIENRLFDICSNPLNPTGLIIIEKQNNSYEENEQILACPITKTKLTRYHDAYYSTESMLAYPVISNIPCLLPTNAIIATKFLETIDLTI